jgi:hypothetical protein
MDDYQAREFEALEGILCDPCAEPFMLAGIHGPSLL